MPDGAAKEILYTSFYRHGVDGKRRLHLPFRWRSDKSVELTLMVSNKHQAGPCLRVLPPAQLAKMRQQIEEMPLNKRADAKRTLANACTLVELDSAGRITLPEEMKTTAGIGSEAVLSGLFDYFEVWNPELYAKAKAIDAVTSSALNEFLE